MLPIIKACGQDRVVTVCGLTSARYCEESRMPETHIFHLAPAVAKTYWLWVLALPIVIAAVVAVFVLYAVLSVKNATFEITKDELRISAGFYSRTIPAADLIIDRAKALNLYNEPSLAPKMRRNGVGLPGLQAGWFTLANGEKSLIFLTDRSRVIYAPTRKKFSLIFSTPDPQALLERLQRLSPS